MCHVPIKGTFVVLVGISLYHVKFSVKFSCFASNLYVCYLSMVAIHVFLLDDGSCNFYNATIEKH